MRPKRSIKSVWQIPLLAFLLLSTLNVLADDPEPEQRLWAEIRGLQEQLEKSPKDFDTRIALGVYLKELAREIDHVPLIDQAIQLFETTVAQFPNRTEPQALYGSALVLKSKYASIFQKRPLYKKGFRIMDALVEQNPNDLYARLIRGANASLCPRILLRRSIAFEDLNWVAVELQSGKNEHSEELQKTGFYYAGSFALRNKDEKCLDYLLIAASIRKETAIDEKLVKALQEAKTRYAP